MGVAAPWSLLNKLRRSLVAEEGNVVFCFFSGEGGALSAEIELEAESAGPAAQEVPEMDAVVVAHGPLVLLRFLLLVFLSL